MFKPEAGFLKQPGLEPERDLAHFAFSEQGKARPETKGKLAAWPEPKEDKPRASHQPREEELWGALKEMLVAPLPAKECFEQ